MGEVICESCKDKRHDDCRGGSWCDCQHQTTARPDAAAPGDHDGPEPEPLVNWLHQG